MVSPRPVLDLGWFSYLEAKFSTQTAISYGCEVDTSRFPVDAHPIAADEGAKQRGTNGATQVKAALGPIGAQVEKAPRTASKFVGTDIEPNQKSRAIFCQLDAIGGL